MDKQTQEKLLALVKKNYEEIAGDFDLTRKKQLWPELLKLTGIVKDGDRVLDVGCGNGRLVEAFSDKKIYYLGVDNSEKLIGAAINNFQIPITNYQTNSKSQLPNKSQISNLKFQVADILELDKISENNFDYVFCIAVLHHLPGEDLKIKALEQMKNKLKPDGRIVLTVWNLWSQKKFSKLILKYALLKIVGKNKMDFGDILFDWKNNKGEEISRRYYHGFTNNGLKKIAVGAGLKMEKLYKDKYNYYVILTE